MWVNSMPCLPIVQNCITKLAQRISRGKKGKQNRTEHNKTIPA